MEHEYWEERLQGYIDTELDPADHTAVEQHIAGCEACRVQAEYFRIMKKRVRMHTESVDMPDAVAQRLDAMFRRKRKHWLLRLPPSLGIGLAVAAVLTLFVMLPRDAYHFADGLISGKLTCHGCAMAEKAQLTKGDLCKDGHLMGLVDDRGTLWRIAADAEGVHYVRNMDLFGKDVEIQGSMLEPEHLIRIQDVKVVTTRQAAL